jgi:uncharacterized membrane protein YkoI
MNTRIALIGLAGLVGAGVITAGIVVALDDDPTQQVEPVALDDVNRAGERPTSTVGSSDRSVNDESSSPVATATASVAGLEELTGLLRAGRDADDWFVANVEVDFGPDGWLQTTDASADFDGNGTVGTIIEELRGLENSDVRLGVRFDRDDDDRDDADVFTINGIDYRDPTASSAPWQAHTGEPATRDAVVEAALSAVGAGSTMIEVSAENEDGFAGWEVEVRSADNLRYEVLVTASGVVADVRPYDDND